MVDVSKLRISGRNMKGHLSRTLTTLESLVQRETTDRDMIRSYLTKAEEQFSEVEKRHSEVIEVVKDNDFDAEEVWMAECEAKYGGTDKCTTGR